VIRHPAAVFCKANAISILFSDPPFIIGIIGGIIMFNIITDNIITDNIITDNMVVRACGRSPCSRSCAGNMSSCGGERAEHWSGASAPGGRCMGRNAKSSSAAEGGVPEIPPTIDDPTVLTDIRGANTFHG
jgi:hypothetical protein